MPKTLTSTPTDLASDLWVFGRLYRFFRPQLDRGLVDTLHDGDLEGTPANPARFIKRQIVLHGTVSNISAEATVNDWRTNTDPAGAHYVMERDNTAQIARPALAAGIHRSDVGLVDAVQCAPEDWQVYHATQANRASIGIEHVCFLDKFTPGADENEFIRAKPPGFPGADEWQAYTDKQYLTMLLLLRDLCIRHRIPRRFHGVSLADAYHAHGQGRTPGRLGAREQVLTWRGLIMHRAVNRDFRDCPGVIHRNRIYRGIIDQWWLPIDLGQGVRPYYTGPFEKPASTTARSLFRWDGSKLAGTTYKDAKLEPLYDTTSYFDLGDVERYFAETERSRPEGTFPVGRNERWHLGIHLAPPIDHPCVFAAASGTIVAARLTSHADTEAKYGSQRFVLVQHAVHFQRQPDPPGTAGGHGDPDATRIDYDPGAADVVYSLYMHLAPFANLAQEDPQNPPWFNLWLRRNPGVTLETSDPLAALTAVEEGGQVFCPDVEVNVGDLLGLAGRFLGTPLIHFEVFGGRQKGQGMSATSGLTPWNQELIGDENDQVLPGPDEVRLALEGVDEGMGGLRGLQVFMKSEWAVTHPDQLKRIVRDDAQRASIWVHWRRFSWVAQAIAAWTALRTEREQAGKEFFGGAELTDARFFGGADGWFWHYHPITFMQHANDLVRRESLELPEHTLPGHTNVLLDEDGFFSRFVDFDATTGTYTQGSADDPRDPLILSGQRVAEYHDGTDRLRTGGFHLKRRSLACLAPTNFVKHDPAADQPWRTHVSIALLEVVEEALADAKLQDAIEVTASFLCKEHFTHSTTIGKFHVSPCAMLDEQSHGQHLDGVALDLTPAPRAGGKRHAEDCRRLWQALKARVEAFNRDAPARSGDPAFGEIPLGFEGMELFTAPSPEVAERLEGATAKITAEEAQDFRIHVALKKRPPKP